MVKSTLTGAAVLAVGLVMLAVVGLHNLRRRPPRYYRGLGERHTNGQTV